VAALKRKLYLWIANAEPGQNVLPADSSCCACWPIRRRRRARAGGYDYRFAAPDKIGCKSRQPTEFILRIGHTTGPEYLTMPGPSKPTAADLQGDLARKAIDDAYARGPCSRSSGCAQFASIPPTFRTCLHILT
jgi:hypothetical protein